MKSMKYFILLFISTLFAYGQKDTLQIEISKSNSTQIIFPSNVVYKEPGAVAFQFFKTTSRRNNKRILRLYYAGDRKDYTYKSNLQVETEDGYLYDLPIVNVTDPKETSYLISVDRAITNLNESSAATSNFIDSKGNKKVTKAPKTYTHYSDKSDVPSQSNYTVKDSFYLKNKNEYMRKNCEYLITVEPQYSTKKSTAVSQNIELLIKGIYSDKDELYFTFNLKNKGGQPFDLKNWELYKAPASEKEKNLQQPLPYDSEYKFNLSTRVESNSEMDFVIVVSKFTIAKNKAVYFDIDELNGERDIYIPLYDKKVNYPINVNTIKK